MPRDILNRVFLIRYGGKTGTGFTIDVDDKQYIVTAQHLVSEFAHGDEIGINYIESAYLLDVTLIGHSPNADISVFTANRHVLTPPEHTMLVGSIGAVSHGEDVFFLGFPLGMTGGPLISVDELSSPFVKKAFISTVNMPEKKIYLDGHNNPGFSGGPVVQKVADTDEFCVVGVISGYIPISQPVLDAEGIGTGLFYTENAGIICADSIEWAIDVINANPTGRPLSESVPV